VRVVIAEDLALLRDGLTRLLQAFDFDVVEAVDNGPALLPALLRHRPDVAIVDVRLPPTYTDEGLKAAIAARTAQLGEAGAPERLAQSAAVLQSLTTAADLVDLAEASSWPLPNVARLYHAAGAAFAFDRLRAAAGEFRAGDIFERTALRRLLEDMLAEQAALTRAVMDFAGSAQAGEDADHAAKAVAGWTALRRDKAEAARRTVEEIDQSGGQWTFAKLTIANAALRELAEDRGGKRKR